MAFESWADFISMGGHALYVWLSYGLAILVVIFNWMSVRQLRKSLLAISKRRNRREQFDE